MQTVWTQIRPDKSSDPVCIQVVLHSDVIPERSFEKVMLKNICRRPKIMKNYTACKWLKRKLNMPCHGSGMMTGYDFLDEIL